MLSTLPRDRMLSIPIYLAHVVDWKPSSPRPHLPGYSTLDGMKPDKATKKYGFAVLMPKAFPKADRAGNRRVVVIDDSITSGFVPPVIADHLRSLKYREGAGLKGTFKIACYVCYRGPTIAREPDHFVIPTKAETYHFPWGDSIWYPRRTGSEKR